jgi:predicted house-cleaning noncanonical NTP pyrophosphatase (MazG superfamily)
MAREYDKLVRDDVPAEIREDDETPVTHRAEGEEYRDRLAAKLVEEAEEFAEGRTVAELGDVLDVVDAICAARDVDRDYLEEMRAAKTDDRGGFVEGVVLERVEPTEDHREPDFESPDE